MVQLGMIETIGSGIKKMFVLQKERFLPLPDYFLTENVELTIYGTVLNQGYTNKLIENQDLDLATVFLLDKLQKGQPIGKIDYRYMIIHFLKQKRRADRETINNLLIGVLDNNLTENQKQTKIKNMLYKLSKDGLIKNISTSKKTSIWVINN